MPRIGTGPDAATREILWNWAGIGVEWCTHLLDDVVYAFTAAFEAESEGCHGGWLSLQMKLIGFSEHEIEISLDNL